MPLFALGSNGNGQLGIGSDEDTARPCPVLLGVNSNNSSAKNDCNRGFFTTSSTWTTSTLSPSPFHDFAAGGNHTAFITRDLSRRMYMTGSNKDGEALFQEPSFNFQSHDILHRDQHPSNPILTLNKQDPLKRIKHAPAATATAAATARTLKRWRAVACGWAFTIAVTEPEPVPEPESELAEVASKNEQGQLDREQEQQEQQQPQVYAWGSGSFGELGLGPGLSKTGQKAILITLDPNLWRDDSNGTSSVVYEATKVKAGLRHVLLLLTEIETNATLDSQRTRRRRTILVGWGSNRQGQLGILERKRGRGNTGSLSPPYTEKELRGKFMEPTRIRIPPTFSSSSSPQDMGETTIVDMTCGQNHSLILLSDGSVYASGLNKYGQLGPGLDSGTTTTSGQSPPQLSSSSAEFRTGFERVRGLPFVDLISCGWNHNGAMDSQDRTRLYLWGRNDHGQLGDGTSSSTNNNSSRINVVRIPKSNVIGMGGQDLKESDDRFEEIESFSCGSEHCLVMTRSGRCYAWGWNEHGNCGTNPDGVDDRQDVLSPRQIHCSSTGTLSISGSGGWVAGGYGSSWISTSP